MAPSNENARGTEILRDYLKLNHVANPGAYTWSDGEALYLGDPIAGRATESERLSVEKTNKMLIQIGWKWFF